MQSKTLCHCFECGYTIEVEHENPKVITCGTFLEHKIAGSDVRCLQPGDGVMKYQKTIGSNKDFTLHLMTIHRPTQ